MANADTAELNKFNQLADNWWDPEGEFKTLHEINPLRLDYILNHSGSLKDKRVVDVGCGGGVLSESLARQGAEVTGLDLADDVLNTAKKHAQSQQLSINYQLLAVEDWAEKHAAEYDVVSCMEMLEHVPDPAKVISACCKLCKPGGHIFLSTISRTAKAFFMAIVGAEYLLRLLPRGTHEYAKFIRPSELAGWIRQNNLMLKDISGMHFDALSGNHSLTQDVSVNYLMHCIKPNE
jgi:2-polyprenyl-6-hydroxyphenyl methylase/3-demethylubiquinone-9 3-methyltransferase